MGFVSTLVRLYKILEASRSLFGERGAENWQLERAKGQGPRASKGEETE